jgi:DNA-directed RNA polymerase specialized sigma24 family protein
VTQDLDVHLPSIAAGDDLAFAAWLAGAEEPVRRSLRSFAAQVDTEAVLQEALLRVWQVAPRIQRDGKANSLLRFALRVARNVAIDEVRRLRASPVDAQTLELALHEALGPDEPQVPDPALRKAIERCREGLPPAPRRVFEARLASAGASSDRDLASGLDMQLNTFLKNVGRARALLLECLARAGVVWESL